MLYDVHHWDTFDNETIKINSRGLKSLKAAEAFVKKRYGDRLRANGADQVDIVERPTGKIVKHFKVG